MTLADKALRIGAQLDQLYPAPQIPLDHADPYTLLVSVLLSAQTTDARVNQVTPALFAVAPNPKAMVKLGESKILACIKTCGLAPGKAKAIARLSAMLLDEHAGLVPVDMEALERLPGVGHKTASVVMTQAFGVPAFPVDTHIHRLAGRWGLSRAANVVEVEHDLKRLFPQDTWNRRHLQIIYFGREHCPARAHDPVRCPICSWATTKSRIAAEAKAGHAKPAPAKRAKKATTKAELKALRSAKVQGPTKLVPERASRKGTNAQPDGEGLRPARVPAPTKLDAERGPQSGSKPRPDGDEDTLRAADEKPGLASRSRSAVTGSARRDLLKLWSWNVNGLRAAYQKGFLGWLESCGGDVVGVQETRSRVDQLPRELSQPARWWSRTVAANRAGYSGVTMFAREPPDEYVDSLGEPRFDDEGRFQAGRWGDLWIANVYFPNGNGKERDNSRVPFKLDFYRSVQRWSDACRASGQSVVVMGDFNTAHTAIDLARPKDNLKTSGFLAQERAELDAWIGAGYLDSFRCLINEAGHYSWWTARGDARERNIGWRIDLLMISPELRDRLSDVMIDPAQLGSDHCPVGLTLHRA